MATVRALVLAAFVLSPFLADAQTVEYIELSKGVEYVQTSDAPPIPNPTPPGPAYGGPYGFGVAIGGTGISGITPPALTVPPGSGILQPFMAPTYNGGVLGWDANEQEWKFGSPNFNNFGAPTRADIDNLFHSGLYTFSVQGATVALNLVPPAVFGPPPAFTLTGGTWIDGKYVVNVHDTVTITSNSFAGYGANLNGFVYMDIGGDSGNVAFVSRTYSEEPAADHVSLTIDPCTLVSGYEYGVRGAFIALVDYNTGVPGIPASQNYAFQDEETVLFISAVGTPCDTTAPVITRLTTSAPTLWPPNHKMMPVTVTALATDDTSAVTTRIVSVTSNEPDNGLGDGDTSGDYEITGPMAVKLRAERAGNGSGRIYTITVEAADEAGNTTTAQVEVRVPHSRR